MPIKKKAKEALTTTKRVASNVERFIQATALVITSVFSYQALQQIELNTVTYGAIFVSLVIIALRAAYEYFTVFNAERK